MTKVILDTSFILTAIKGKIDFFREIDNLGFKILIPKQVINEIILIANSKRKLKNRTLAKTALKIIENENFKEVDLKVNNVDRGLLKFSRKNFELIIATLDKELAKKIKNKKLIIRAKKKLEIA